MDDEGEDDMQEAVRSAGAYGSDGRGRQRGRRVAAWMMVIAGLMTMGMGVSPGTAQAQARPLKIVAFGDSLTAGYNLPASAAFPAVLEAELKARGHAVEVANAGVSGDTATAGLARVDWSVPDGTGGVIVELGANDMLRGVDPAVTEKALDAILARLKARGIPTMIVGMYAPRNLGADYVRRFEGIYPALAEKYGAVLYPFFLDGVTGGAARLVLGDGLHPSAAGVKIMVERILPSVETFLARLKS